MTQETAVSSTPKYVDGRTRQYLQNGTGGALAVGDLVYLDTSAVGKVADPMTGTVTTGTDFYKVRKGVNEDIASGIALVCLEVLADLASGMFLQEGEAELSCNNSAIIVGSRLMPVSVTGTLALTAKLAAAAAGNVKVIAISKEANGSAAGIMTVSFSGRSGFGSLGI